MPTLRRSAWTVSVCRLACCESTISVSRRKPPETGLAGRIMTPSAAIDATMRTRAGASGATSHGRAPGGAWHVTQLATLPRSNGR